MKAPTAARPRGGAIGGLLTKSLAIVDMELRKLRRDPTELLTRAIQPALWLLLFGEVMSHSRALSTGDTPYLDFLVPGILAQSVLFIAIFNGISIIWERDLGIVHKLLVSPTPRVALVMGKAASGGVRALAQAVVVLLLGLALGVHLRMQVPTLAMVIVLVLLGASVFSTFSLIIACIVKTRERFMGIGQVLTMPLFFASNAIYPIGMMPTWLQRVARLNPLSYEVDGLRILLLGHSGIPGNSEFGVALDVGVLALALAALTVVAAHQYPKIIQ